MRLASYSIEKRGPHATGFAWTDKDGKSWYDKSPGKATDVAHTFDLSGARLAIGHTRFATQGKPEKNENNHPLIEGGITLVHNGIMYNDDWVFKQLTGLPRLNEVDSQAIACLLAYPDEFGAKDAAHVLEDNFEGDAALAWLDGDTPEVLHLARVIGRPMFIGWTRKGDLVMASEDDNLTWLERASGISIGDVEEVPEGTYMQVHKGKVIHKEEFFPYRSYAHYSWSGSSSTKKKKDDNKPVVLGSAATKPELDKPREVVQHHEFDWDDEDLVEAVLTFSKANYDFLDWDEDRLILEMAEDWGITRDDCGSQHDFDECLLAYRKELHEDAELQDYLAAREFMDGEIIDAEVIEEEVSA
jgi:hypothetical protein